MTQAVTTAGSVRSVAVYSETFSREQLDLLKRTVAAGTSDDEFALFCEVARSSGLNPFQRQVYAIMRDTWDPATKTKKPKMTIQTGIDGYRLMASRTGVHAGTSDALYGGEANGRPAWASVTVYKLVGGVKVEFPATARWSEYAQVDREGRPTGQWGKMPYLMLGKCAEALALRKAFPAELSGVYTAEEMAQADSAAQMTREHAEAPSSLSQAQIRRLYAIAKDNGIDSKEALRAWLVTIPGFPPKEGQLSREQFEWACDFGLPQYGAALRGEPAGQETEAIEAEVVSNDDQEIP